MSPEVPVCPPRSPAATQPEQVSTGVVRTGARPPTLLLLLPRPQPRVWLWGQQSPWGPCVGPVTAPARHGTSGSCSLQSQFPQKSPPGGIGASSAPPCLSFPAAWRRDCRTRACWRRQCQPGAGTARRAEVSRRARSCRISLFLSFSSLPPPRRGRGSAHGVLGADQDGDGGERAAVAAGAGGGQGHPVHHQPPPAALLLPPRRPGALAAHPQRGRRGEKVRLSPGCPRQSQPCHPRLEPQDLSPRALPSRVLPLPRGPAAGIALLSSSGCTIWVGTSPRGLAAPCGTPGLAFLAPTPTHPPTAPRPGEPEGSPGGRGAARRCLFVPVCPPDPSRPSSRRVLGSSGTITLRCKDLRVLQLEIPGMEQCLNIASSIEVRPGKGKAGRGKGKALPCLLWGWHQLGKHAAPAALAHGDVAGVPEQLRLCPRLRRCPRWTR